MEVSLTGGNIYDAVNKGVGVGGTFDYIAHLAKKSLIRKIGERNSDPEIAALETE